MGRVQYYSVNDSAIIYDKENMDRVIMNFNFDKKYENINDIIEIYNIKKYIDQGIYPSFWLPEDIKKSKDISKKYMKIVGKFYGTISNQNIEDLFDYVEIEYKSNFWEIFNDFKVYKKISNDKIHNLLNKSKRIVHYLLEHKDLVDYYGQVIRDELVSEDFYAELILDKYEVNHNNYQIFFPNELNIEDKEQIIINYINSQNPNPNYLRVIITINSTDKLRISDRTRLNAKRRFEEEQNKLFEKNTGTTIETAVAFSEKQEEVVKTEINGINLSVSYSLKWIKENSDYNTLMNNYIYLFGFVDMQMRITLVSKQQEMSVLEKHLFMRTKKSYIIGSAFNRKDILSILQIKGYYQELNRIGIRLEEVIEWFFKYYLTDEFGISEFNIKMPSEHSLYIEKCRAILPEMEYILKQFSLYVKEGEIDQELLQMSSGHLFLKDIPSLLDRKYAYGYGDEFENVTYYLFSDQCMLSYIKRYEDKYKSFVELLIKENVCIDDYHECYKSNLNWLIDKGYISLSSEGYIRICDLTKVYILKDLYDNEFISYWRYSHDMRVVVDNLESEGIVKFESSLFSKYECDYINYYLNKSSFNNGLDLRNMYSHGTQPSGEESENIHKSNYIIFLRLFILIIIKINDEFCLSNKE
ncbi:hypothetical protein [Paraclostridium sordellii]|uniref:hypothetical protein n=1 Tax=Paraclostridium sordellii TaxID=1505 RepID=UPI0005E9A5A9|nr:hypothetical protein [Paeniclostridium sordellii]CEN81263.1 putative orphan protein [[Clostridium] sordellii] [Paeniclostridium sordellii]